MGAPPKEKLSLDSETETEEGSEREVFLRDGKRLVVSEQGADQVVEIRNESGMLEVRIKLTDQGPVLQMEGARLQLKGTESVEIDSKKVAIKAEQINLDGGNVSIKSEEDVEVEGKNDVRVVGKMIYLN
ncbi:MAG TPA: hypothetical protein VGM39_26645 [Kofleriaceae bacterium]|jgi:hypothetical protein